MVYTIQLLIIFMNALICFGGTLKSDHNRKIFMFITFFMLAFVMGFRDTSVGVDTTSYSHYFSLISQIPINSLFVNIDKIGLEPGWVIVNKLVSIFFNNYYVLQLCYSIVYCWLSSKFVERISNNLFVGVILYLGIGLYTGSFNVQRQFLAMMLLANGYLDLSENKVKNTFASFIFATLIHRTSIVFLIALFIYFLRNNKFLMRIMPLALVAVAVSYRRIISIAQTYMPYYFNYYNNYKGTQSASGVWIIWIIIIGIALACLYGKNSKYNDFKPICIFSLAYVICNIVGLYFNYFERLGWYFMPFIPVLFMEYGDKILASRYRLLYFTGVTVCFAAYYLLSCYTGRALQYSFWF